MSRNPVKRVFKEDFKLATIVAQKNRIVKGVNKKMSEFYQSQLKSIAAERELLRAGYAAKARAEMRAVSASESVEDIMAAVDRLRAYTDALRERLNALERDEAYCTAKATEVSD